MGSIPSIPANKEYIPDSRISFSDRSDVINREGKRYKCAPPYLNGSVSREVQAEDCGSSYVGSSPTL